MAHPNARASRATEERQERRRRRDGTLDRMDELTLAIPEEVRAKNPGKDFRWINDTGRRMYLKTQKDDWDTVEGVEPITVGTDREGKPMKAYLCAKPKEFVAEDMAAKMSLLREQEQGIVRGERDAAGKSDLPDAVTYTTPGENRISKATLSP